MDLKAHMPLVMVPIVIMSITLGAAFSISNEGVPVPPNPNIPPWPMDDLPVVFLGANPESNPILDGIGRTSTNITRSDSLPALDLVNSDYMVLIDGQWAQGEDQRELISAVRSLILAGVPIVIVNGEPDIIREAINGDKRIGFMTAETSNPLRSAGIHYDALSHSGGGYAYSSIDGDLSMAGMNAYMWCAQFL